MKQVRAFKNLQSLEMESAAVTADRLAELKDLPLRSLHLYRATKITDAALRVIKQFNELETLSLGFTGYQGDRWHVSIPATRLGLSGPDQRRG